MMSVANEVLTMCRRGGELLRKALLVRTSVVLRCCTVVIAVLLYSWSEPVLCCVVLLFCSAEQALSCFTVGQKQHRTALLHCCAGVLVGTTSVVVLLCCVGENQHRAALLCWCVGGQNQRCVVVLLVRTSTIVLVGTTSVGRR